MSKMCHAVFSSGGISSIIFGDYLRDSELSLVSKAFLAANQRAMAQTGECITLQDRVLVGTISERAKLICREESPQARAEGLFGEIEARVNEIPFHIVDVRKEGLLKGLQKLRQIFMRYMQEENPEIRARHAARFVVHLTSLRDNVANAENPRVLESDDYYRGLLEQGRAFLTSEQLAERFIESRFSFPGLHVSQRNAVAFSVEHSERLAHLAPHSFSPAHLRETEGLVIDAESMRDLALRGLWFLVRQEINVGPAIDAPLADIRAWMNNDLHLVALDQVTELHLGGRGSSICPPEIGRLQQLRRLFLENGYLRTLPEELDDFPLEEVFLRNQHLREFPDFLVRWSGHLKYVNLQGNPEIRTIPDDFARNYYGWTMILFEGLGQSVDVAISLGGANIFGFRVSTSDDRFLSLRREQLTDIPFSLWFRDSFSIPHLPLMGLGVVAAGMEWVRKLISPINQVKGCLALPIFLLFGVLALLCIALEVHFFLLNALINQAIEPLVSLIRDQFNYPRMVHVRDVPPNQA